MGGLTPEERAALEIKELRELQAFMCPEEHGIDVERLSQAIREVDRRLAEESERLRPIADPKHDDTRRNFALAIAAAYNGTPAPSSLKEGSS